MGQYLKNGADPERGSDTQRKPSTIHETHVPFNSMRYLSPAELSRMKTEKDAKTTHDIQLRKRQEEVTRATQLQARLTSVSNIFSCDWIR